MKNKLIIFAYDFPPSNGGIARLCHEIACGLYKDFEEVIVLTRSKRGNLITRKEEDFSFVYLPEKRIKCELAAFKYLKNINNKNDYIVICGLWHPEGFLSILSGMPNTYILGHGGEFLSGTSLFKKLIWLGVYARFTLNKVSGVIANSSFTKDLIQKITKKANVSTLTLAVDEKLFIPLQKKVEKNKESLKIITVSRLQPHKGHLFVLEAIANLPKNYKKKIFWSIVGIGPYKNTIEAKINELRLQNQVHFKGFVSDKDLAATYNASDLFVLCSKYSEGQSSVEGFGLVFLEAQSCGLPVIGTKSGGIVDAVEHNNGGWLVDSYRTNELEDLLISIIDNFDVLSVESRKARNRILQNYTWDKYCKNFLEIVST